MLKTNFISAKITILFILLFTISYSVKSQVVSDGIVTAFKTGNATEIAKSYNSSVELIILEKEQVCSKPQAEIILKDFFAKNKPTDFKIIHQGSKDVTKFAIGNLTCGAKVYRVNFLFKAKDNQSLIHQLRIEANNE
jgi:hypothetical protein